MMRWRTLRARGYHDAKGGCDLRLIIFFVAALAIGCGSNATGPLQDAAGDARDWIPDADLGRDQREREDVADGPAEGGEDGNALLVLPAQFTEENMPLRMLAEGDPIDLWPAPQGGHVVLVGAKVKNLESDTVILRVRARYPDTPFIVAEEARLVKMVPVPGEPGTTQPELQTRTQVAHVPLCPDYDPMDIVDRPLEFTVTVTPTSSDAGLSSTATLHLLPKCLPGPSEAFCRCECSANYVLGKCAKDAGTRD
jgi:hypothetical protein